MDGVSIVKKDVKNFNIKVTPSCDVILTAPLAASDEHIDYILEKREQWISKKLEFFRATKKSFERRYVCGEEFQYLGKTYRLKIIESDRNYGKLSGGFFKVFVKDTKDLKLKEKIVKSWYKQRALEKFYNILLDLSRVVKKDVRSVKVRQMKSRWGSCNPKKSYINLNLELIKKPKVCIEYVIFHELTHLIYPNHSKEFYNYLSTYMSDWKARKELLERI